MTGFGILCPAFLRHGSPLVMIRFVRDGRNKRRAARIRLRDLKKNLPAFLRVREGGGPRAQRIGGRDGYAELAFGDELRTQLDPFHDLGGSPVSSVNSRAFLRVPAFIMG